MTREGVLLGSGKLASLVGGIVPARARVELVPDLGVTTEVVFSAEGHLAVSASPFYAIKEDDTRKGVNRTITFEIAERASVMVPREAFTTDPVVLYVVIKVRLAAESDQAMTTSKAPTARCAVNEQDIWVTVGSSILGDRPVQGHFRTSEAYSWLVGDRFWFVVVLMPMCSDALDAALLRLHLVACAGC